MRQKPAQLDRLVEIARIQSTEASNRIEGIVTTSTRIKKLLEEKIIPKNRDEKEILGYRDVLNTIHESHDYIDVVPNHILQLHRDLLKYAGFSFGGNFKNVQNYIKETRSDGTEVVRFTPLAPYETPEAVEMICKSYAETAALEVVDSKFTAADVLANCPNVGRTSVFNALKKLTNEGYIEKYGERKKAFYVKKNKSI